MTGGAGADTFRGGSGDDTVWGGGGNDHLAGDVGKDRLFGGAGNDQILIEFEDDAPMAASASGGSGTDLFAVTDLNDVEEIPEDDEEVGEPAPLNLTVTLTSAGNVVLNGQTIGSGFERLQVQADGARLTATGGAGNDELRGSDGPDRLFGGGGDDRIGLLDLNGNDVALGGATAQGGAGTDQLEIHLFATDKPTVLRASGDRAIMNGVTVASGFETFVFLGGEGADTLTGGARADTLAGGDGADRLNGGGGNDLFRFDLLRNAAPAADIVTG